MGCEVVRAAVIAAGTCATTTGTETDTPGTLNVRWVRPFPTATNDTVAVS
jgi:hypothetical protein